MPPVRTMTAAKPIKTERTHEENQERAYIAASRRSDRSLEARVESARRASEIHKRRTGRSLRVTEQDVVNEEMYEEEDDDLPMQYRRLTAHLQTSNADFDRRLAAYLTNHVAMRTALGHAVSDSYNNNPSPNNHGYPNAPQFANQGQQFQQNAFTPSNQMLPPQNMNRSPTSYRQTPYPLPAQQQGMRNMHGRSASVASPQEVHGYSNGLVQQQAPAETIQERRMSMPVSGPQAQMASQPQPTSGHVSPSSRTSSSSNLANLKLEAAQHGFFHNQQQGQGSPARPNSGHNQSFQPSNFPTPFNFSGLFDNHGNAPSFNHPNNPFSTTLPPESQQLLSGTFDSMDPMTSMLMGGEHKHQQPFYSYNPNGLGKKNFNSTPGFDGMNQTLAPGMLETNFSQMPFTGPHSGQTDSVISPFTLSGGFGGFDSSFDALKPDGGMASGQNTPNDRDWSSLLDGTMWEEPSSQPAPA